jgi:hypothetical protein
MNIEFTGKVSNVLPLQSGMGQRGPWSRATVVFEIQNGRYSQKIACENTSDAEKFSKLAVGQTVSVKADVFSREYNGKWYSSILCYEFSPQGENAQQYAAPVTGTPQPF